MIRVFEILKELSFYLQVSQLANAGEYELVKEMMSNHRN